MVKNILDEVSLDKEIKEGNFVVVDFWASFCTPCEMLEPIFEEVSEELGEKAKFLRINIFDHEEIAKKFDTYTVPAVIIFKDGNIVDKSLGFKPKEVMVQWIEKYINL